MNGVLVAHAVKDMPDGGLKGLEIGVGFGAEPLVFNFTPQGLDFVEVRAVGGQIEHVHVLRFPRRQTGLESGGMVDFGVIEHEYGGAGARGGPGIERVDDNRACR